jgi:catechol 2,3-dioxygenase
VEEKMPLPKTNLNPPFNITRASHLVLTARDLAASRAFYCDVIGLVVSAEERDVLYLRGLEEACHHSVVIRKSLEPRCERIGLRVFTEEDLDRAKAYFDRNGVRSSWAQIPYQGRSIHLEDDVAVPLEICATMTTMDRQMQEFHLFRGGSPQRLDHFQIATHDVAAATNFYASLGFRVTEYTAADGTDELWGTWMQRKGNTHDIVFTNGRGPRLHHFAFTCVDVHDLIHVCDTAGAKGFGDVIERGPARHGISNALFVYLRDPDGHRIELFTSHYQAIDIENEPIRWSLTNTRRSQLWGMPASKRWFYEATDFEGARPIEPLLKADPVTLERYLASQH